MAVALRLTRLGKKHMPHYRIIAVDKKKKRDGRYIERLGVYDPIRDMLELDQEKFAAWTSKGAQVSEGLARLLKKYRDPNKSKSHPNDPNS